MDVNFHHLAKSEGTPVDKNIVIHPGIVYFRPLSIFLECYKHVYKEIPMHSSVINIRYYPYELSRMCETPFFKWGVDLSENKI